MNFIRSLIFAICFILTTLVLGPLVLLARPFPFHQRYKFAVQWPRFLIFLAKVILGIRYEVRGKENIPTDRQVIYLIKHQSAYETLFIPWFTPHPVVFVYKKVLEYIPLFGWALASLNNIPIDRGRSSEALRQVLRRGSKRIKEGRSPVLFPEGTRIPVGKKGRYKPGGVRLAMHTNTEIIPVAHNAGKLWPRNSFMKKSGTVTISFGQAIKPGDRSCDDITAELEGWIESEMIRLNPEDYPSSNSADTPLYSVKKKR
ncbi:MAG: 1-acyl-sn-glycerol-3-phosphate acyltransferase [Alcaligenaceae bacterium]|jgi:1-acyl-sn-glycerol-3-phosphate acyltransferase|nr:1-acyl-sn-glycerol-3-phosphate acyltransferase [Alcaligenaceae bacterium]